LKHDSGVASRNKQVRSAWIVLGGCRPIIVMNGCHLKSVAGGVLLNVVSIM